MLYTYEDFTKNLKEDADLSKPENPGVILNYADESIDGLRRSLLDEYLPKATDELQKKTINSCITTYVYALDKKLKIDEDIVKKLGEIVGKKHSEISKELAEKTLKFYNN